jgi:hypothetical protein
MTSLFDWISLLFMAFVFIISSLVILYSDDYIFDDLNILLVLIFVFSIMFLIINTNVISILLGPLSRSFKKQVVCRKVLKQHTLSHKAQTSRP